MKKQFSFSALSFCLYLMAQLWCSTTVSAQKSTHNHGDIDHVCLHQNSTAKTTSDEPPVGVEPTIFETAAAAPNVSVTFDQEENNTFLYHLVGGWTGSSSVKAQVSLVIRVKNQEPNTITWNKVVLQYTQGGVVKAKTLTFSQAISPNTWKAYQNSRDYHLEGDVVYIDAPIPANFTVKLYFTGFTTPITITKPLAAYNQAYGMPFRAFDLASNEVWQSGSTHGGGSQVFAYDMSVQGLENGTWTYNLPGTDGTQNSHARIWGKPIYAMADGVVKGFLNDCPNNPSPGQQANWQAYTNGGAGNHFYIQHGENIALYAHMQKGTLNSALMAVGAVVKVGDFLGYAGNSGSSTGPHLHIHLRKETSIESGPFRPLIFNNGNVIAKTSFTSLDNSADWFKLTAHGIPGFTSTRAFIWPSNAKPFYSTNVYNGVWEDGSYGHALWVGATSAGIVNKDNQYKNSGLRMTDLNVVKIDGVVQYSGVWKAGSGVSALQTGTTYNNFVSQWTTLSGQGYRLLDIEIYKDANNATKYAGVYGEGNWGHYLFVGMTQTDFNAKWSELAGQGYRLVDVEVYQVGSATKYAGIWKPGTGGYGLWHANSWASFTDKWAELSGQGLRLVDLDTDGTGNSTKYSGTFIAGTGGHYLWQSNWNSFVSKWEHNSSRGLRLIDINIRPVSGAYSEVPIEDRAEETEEAAPETATISLQSAPNPFRDRTVIRYELTEDAPVTLKIMDMLGKSITVLINNEEQMAGTHEAIFEANDLPSGIYVCELTAGKQRTTQRIVLNRF